MVVVRGIFTNEIIEMLSANRDKVIKARIGRTPRVSANVGLSWAIQGADRVFEPKEGGVFD